MVEGRLSGKQVLFATTEGTPQGGIISPVLANRTLDGLQQLLTDRFGPTRSRHKECKVHLVRYADDFIITGTSRLLLQYEVQPLVAHFLASGVSNSPTRRPGSRILRTVSTF